MGAGPWQLGRLALRWALTTFRGVLASEQRRAGNLHFVLAWAA